jgi:hypothetical protein
VIHVYQLYSFWFDVDGFGKTFVYAMIFCGKLQYVLNAKHLYLHELLKSLVGLMNAVLIISYDFITAFVILPVGLGFFLVIGVHKVI